MGVDRESSGGEGGVEEGFLRCGITDEATFPNLHDFVLTLDKPQGGGRSEAPVQKPRGGGGRGGSEAGGVKKTRGVKNSYTSLLRLSFTSRSLNSLEFCHSQTDRGVKGGDGGLGGA